MGILPLVAGCPTPKLEKSVTPLLLGRMSHRVYHLLDLKDEQV
jgi:hypothetical protein